MEKHVFVQIQLDKIFINYQPSEQINRLHAELNQKLPIDHKKKIAQYIREQQVKRTQYSRESLVNIPLSVVPYKIEHQTKEFEELKIREIFTHMQISPHESDTEILKKAIISRDIVTTSQQISNFTLQKHISQYKLKMSTKHTLGPTLISLPSIPVIKQIQPMIMKTPPVGVPTSSINSNPEQNVMQESRESVQSLLENHQGSYAELKKKIRVNANLVRNQETMSNTQIKRQIYKEKLQYIKRLKQQHSSK